MLRDQFQSQAHLGANASHAADYLVTLAQSFISEPLLHLYLSFRGNFEN